MLKNEVKRMYWIFKNEELIEEGLTDDEYIYYLFGGDNK